MRKCSKKVTSHFSLFIFALTVLAVMPVRSEENQSGRYNAIDYGVQLNNETFDNTASLQQALNVAGSAGGGIVSLPAGRYRVSGTLSIPAGVTLEGTWRSAPTMEVKNEKPTGTILLAYAGRGKPDSLPFIKLAGNNSSVSGLAIVYPEWNQKTVPPVPYPPCIESMDTNNVSVLNCCLLNPYEGIRFVRAARHLVRNVTGYPIKRGLFVDECYDIGHIENIHFWPFGLTYLANDPYCKWVNLNGVAFEFARTDWHYVFNTFCFGYGVGYKFSDAGNGATNGNFLGIGADSCQRAVRVDAAQKPGLLITNGEFVGRWTSENSICMEIAKTCQGKVSLTNCSFWGPIQTCVEMMAPEGQFTANACHFVNWDNTGEGYPAIAIRAGKAIVQGSTFEQTGPHLVIDQAVRSAILTGNQAEGGFQVEGTCKRILATANEEDQLLIEPAAAEHYSFLIGGKNDTRFLRHWFGPETRPVLDKETGNQVKKSDSDQQAMIPFRWSKRNAMILLPVVPGKEYTMTLKLEVPALAVNKDGKSGIYLNGEQLAKLNPADHEISVKIPAQKTNRIQVEFKTDGWSPSVVSKESNDARKLSLQGFSVHMRADKTELPCFDYNQLSTVLR